MQYEAFESEKAESVREEMSILSLQTTKCCRKGLFRLLGRRDRRLRTNIHRIARFAVQIVFWNVAAQNIH